MSKLNICVVQPEYKVGFEHADECFEKMCALINSVSEEADVIVLPEYCDIPVACATAEDYKECRARYLDRIMQLAKDTAIRCNAVVFVNASYRTEKGYRNTTHAVNQKGEVVGRFYKQHMTPNECKPNSQGGKYDPDYDYPFDRENPYTITIDGVKYGFLTCYDFYFYEDYIGLARQNVDVIIGCSHQRSDTHQALEIINRFLCYNTNAYLARASVSFSEDSPVGGCSSIVAPDGTVLLDLKSKIGLGYYKIDTEKKYYKAAGYGNPPMAHYEYVDNGRKLIESLKPQK